MNGLFNIQTYFTGTPILSMWKDKHFYPGHIASEDKGGKYLVKFEDGTQRQCKDTDIIVCDMLSEGQEVFAEKEDGSGVLATVISSHSEDGEKIYTVQFQDDGEIGKLVNIGYHSNIIHLLSWLLYVQIYCRYTFIISELLSCFILSFVLLQGNESSSES